MFQIASLKAALARKEGESEHSFSGSSEKYRTKTSELSPYHINQRVANTGDQLRCRRPMVEVGNIEVCLLFTCGFLMLMLVKYGCQISISVENNLINAAI
jgi:hypothetical protein